MESNVGLFSLAQRLDELDANSSKMPFLPMVKHN